MELLFPVEGPLTSSQTASIVEAGLTYVLYQRGQIPLPYQQLQISALQQTKFDEEMMRNSDLKNNYAAQALVLEGNSDLDHDGHESSEAMAPRDRISAMLMERRKRILSSKLERRKRQAIAMESKAYNSIHSSLEIFQQLISDVAGNNLGMTKSGHSKKILSMALVLGPSLYCPKEIYCFDLPFPWVSDESTLISKVASSKFESSVLRQFYKKMITNSDLMDFTTKPLPKTYAHICLVTLGDLSSIISGNSYYKDVIRLPTLPPILHQMMHTQLATGESVDASPSPRRPYGFSQSRKVKISKCFKIKIQYQQRPSLMTSEESIDASSCCNENNSSRSDSFSGDILFDNNSFSCYQIPLRFKGVQCKNKRL